MASQNDQVTPRVSPGFKLPLSDEEIERLAVMTLLTAKIDVERDTLPAAPVQVIRRPEDEDGGIAQLVVIEDSNRMIVLRQK